jgi:hypothetical protein
VQPASRTPPAPTESPAASTLRRATATTVRKSPRAPAPPRRHPDGAPVPPAPSLFVS